MFFASCACACQIHAMKLFHKRSIFKLATPEPSRVPSVWRRLLSALRRAIWAFLKRIWTFLMRFGTR